MRRLAIFEIALPGLGFLEAAMQPQPNGQFLWHPGFHSIPDLPEALISGREDIYAQYMFRGAAYDQDAINPERVAHYVSELRAVGGLRAGMEYYQQWFTTAEQCKRHAETKLAMPVLALGGEAAPAAADDVFRHGGRGTSAVA